MIELSRDILSCIGNTRILALRHVVPKNGARVLLKPEPENPTGNMKDRMALAMIEAHAQRSSVYGFIRYPVHTMQMRLRQNFRD